MKIAIPTDEDNKQTNVCISFGRAPFFMLYDSDSSQIDFIRNSAAESAGGAGVKAAQIITDSGAQVLLTPRCGDNAAEVFKAADIAMYKTGEGTALQNIDAFQAGKLPLLTETHAGFHGHGGG